MKTQQLPPELVEKIHKVLKESDDGIYYAQISNKWIAKECAQIAVEYTMSETSRLVKVWNEVTVQRDGLKQQRDELLEAMREFTNAIESEEITIQENCDNDGWENCGGRLYETFKQLINKIDGK